MKNFKTKMKKLLYKTTPCLCVFVLVFSMCFCPLSAASDIGYTEVVKTKIVEYDNLSHIISGVSSGNFLVNDSSSSYNLTTPFIQSTPISEGQYIIEGVINFSDVFNPDYYSYSVKFPISFDTQIIHVGNIEFYLVDKSGNYKVLPRKDSFWPDSISPNHPYQTNLYEFSLSGDELLNISGFRLYITGNNVISPDNHVHCGLLKGRSITISGILHSKEIFWKNYVQSISDAISSGLTVLVPIGIGIMAIFIGIRLIPRVIYMFL